MKAVNLLPGESRGAAKPSPAQKQKAPAGDAFGAYVILGALAMAVVAVAALVLTNNSISDRTAELARVKAESQTVAQQAAALKPYADFKQLAEARVQTVHSLASSRFDWERTLHDLSHALPRQARLSSLSGTASAPEGGGTTAIPKIDLSGCTGSQTSVAKLMARLRAVRGVTRVALRSSTRTGGSELCGGKNVPSFSLSIYFERFNVLPVAPAGGAAAAGATAAAAPAAGAAPVSGQAAAPAATPGAQGSTSLSPHASGHTAAAPDQTPSTSARPPIPQTQGVSAK